MTLGSTALVTAAIISL